jgi:hypothetical protein
VFRTAFAIVLLTTLWGCSNQPKVVLPKPVVKTIAIVPATNPKEVRVQNESALQFLVPIAAAASAVDSKNKSTQFNTKWLEQESRLAALMTDAIANQLRERVTR